MSRIAFFSNHYTRREGTGIARYARQFVNASKELENSIDVIPVATWSNKNVQELSALKERSGLRLLPTGRWLTPLLWLSLGFPKLEHLLDIRVDLVHACYLGGYPVATTKPLLVTVHDIGPLLHPEFFKKSSFWHKKKNLKQALKRADAFICVSHATANSLKDYVRRRYSLDVSNRTFVVHEGIAERFFQSPVPMILEQDDEIDVCNQPFLLAVGKISPRKNLDVVIKAFKKLSDQIPHHLVTVGGDGWDVQGVKELVTSLQLEDRVHFLGYVSDETLHAFYSQAALFVFPSLFEGFGLPVLEAMAAGCPVITSNISSLPEVAGDAAVLVDPYHVDDVAEAIEAVCETQSFADELKRKGRERARQFSWMRCAQETQNIYTRFIS
jgi:glycosyltransferase involved in cell wall biosynthesis